MNKKQLVEHIAKEAGLSKKQAQKAVEAMLGGITKALKKGDKVTFVGFGTFMVRKRKARKARNPRDPSQIIKVPARK
ncbi:MAG TPA: HU family DNA-binding protein, partial [candidate division WOR-3 bacterium]|nr:HU family DNA-binding protein [candidate division WOR-3 bacterium]